MSSKNLYIIAGPNGSGKTTFAREFLPLYAHCENFINADLIAQGLSPFSPRTAAIKAGRLVLQEIQNLSTKGVDFAFETTLSGKAYLTLIKELKAKGYQVHLFFLWIPSVDLALGRVKDRVASGGHDVPTVDVRRRFRRSSHNFLNFYRPLLNSWYLFDNSSAAHSLVAKENDGKLTVMNADLFVQISKAAK